MKKLFDSVLTRLIRQGCLRVTWPDGSSSLYQGTEWPEAAFKLRDSATVRRLAMNPALVLGEAYMDGGLEPVECGIYDVLKVMISNYAGAPSHPLLRVHQMARGAFRRLHQFNNPLRSRAHVAHHYDLDSRLYRLILDKDQQYSCAYFKHGDETLEEAQLAKKRLIARKLLLTQPDLRVLDIGCGWGGMARTLASEFGARVHGITLSTEQLDHARQAAQAAGLADRVTFELADYRHIDQSFDRIVSVGMMEHVGIANYDKFIGVVRKCLTPDGVALIHHIGRTDGPGSTNPWLSKYIFPGGYSPALSEVMPAIERSGLMTTDIEVLRMHYARTIEHWRARFGAHRDEICAMYDERFCRMFEFYLAAVELAFIYEQHVVFQIQLSPNQTSLPLTRDYIYAGGDKNPTPVLARSLAE